ncbi:MAG: acyltransferase [Gemmatimonadaceae bacterium]
MTKTALQESPLNALTDTIDSRRPVTAGERARDEQESTRLPERNLDVLRAVAVLCVLANHTALLAYQKASVVALVTRIGNAGVQLFFVHTALVLMASLERQGESRPSLVTFYLRRAFRIYPLAIATVLLVVAVGIPRFPPVIGTQAEVDHWSLGVVAANIALVQNVLNLQDVLGPFWTLPVEVDMYLLLPFCFLIARSPRSRGMVALFVALVAASFVTTNSRVPGAWRLNVFHYGPCFFGGVLAFHLLRDRARAKLPPWTLVPVIIATVVAVPILAGVSPVYVSLWAPCLFLGMTLPWIGELPPSLVTIAGKTIARYSYGIYLLHIPIFWFAFGACRALPLGAQASIAVLGIFLVPWVAFHAVEQPSIRLGQRLTRRRPSLAAIEPVP